LQGIQGLQGEPGPQGIEGPKGDTGDTGPAGPGVAAGGSVGQVLVKASGDDYDTAWKTLQVEYADNTNDGTPYVLTYTNVNTNKLLIVEAYVGARRTNGDTAAAYKIEASAYNRAGVVTLAGTVKTVLFEDNTSYDVQFVVSGNSLQIQVTGAVDESITWKAHYKTVEI
jgi:hypothetical protein